MTAKKTKKTKMVKKSLDLPVSLVEYLEGAAQDLGGGKTVGFSNYACMVLTAAKKLKEEHGIDIVFSGDLIVKAIKGEK